MTREDRARAPRPDDDDPTPATTVPADAPAVECDRCGRRFPNADLLALHLGHEHGSALGAEERTEYERAYDDETAAIRRFRLIAIGGLVLLYFGFLFVYAFVASP